MGKHTELHYEEEGNFLSHFGERAHIFFKHYFPNKTKNHPKNVIHVIFQHGMIEYHKRHEELFDTLRLKFGKKIIISTMDILGHGLSGGHRAYVDQFETFQKDMNKFFEICHERISPEYNTKTFLISHSLGGLISLRTLTDENLKLPFPIDGLIFCNPCISPKLELPSIAVKTMDHIPSTLNRVRVPLIYDAYDLSHDEEKAISFMHDHLISKSITIKLGIETLRACKHVNSLSYFLTIPCFFILSGDDRVVDNEKAQLFITGMDKNLVKVKYYPNMRHDILNETCRNDVFGEIINYIESFRK
ncbi:MAG: lysophospholipase [Bacteriovoracaceae bacterium]|jgi:alpha-beta hydrolase superfamily lysophospholipase